MVVLNLNIINLVGKTLAAKAQQTSVIKNFINHICSVQKLRLGEYRLMYEGRELDDNRTFCDQKIKDNSILLLCLKNLNKEIKDQSNENKSIYQVQAVSRYLKQKTAVEEKMLKQHRNLVDQQKKISQKVLSRDKSQQHSVNSQQLLGEQKLLMKKSSQMLQRHQTELQNLAQNQSNRLIQYQNQIQQYRQKERRTLLQFMNSINKQVELQKQRLSRYIIQVNNQMNKQRQRLIKFRDEINEYIIQQSQRLHKYTTFVDKQLSSQQIRLQRYLSLIKEQQSVELGKLKSHVQRINQQLLKQIDRSHFGSKIESKQLQLSEKFQILRSQTKVGQQKFNLPGNKQIQQRQERIAALNQYIQKTVQQRKKQVKKLTEKIKNIESQTYKQQYRLKNQIKYINEEKNVEKARLKEYEQKINLLMEIPSNNAPSKLLQQNPILSSN